MSTFDKAAERYKVAFQKLQTEWNAISTNCKKAMDAATLGGIIEGKGGKTGYLFDSSSSEYEKIYKAKGEAEDAFDRVKMDLENISDPNPKWIQLIVERANRADELVAELTDDKKWGEPIPTLKRLCLFPESIEPKVLTWKLEELANDIRFIRFKTYRLEPLSEPPKEGGEVPTENQLNLSVPAGDYRVSNEGMPYEDDDPKWFWARLAWRRLSSISIQKEIHETNKDDKREEKIQEALIKHRSGGKGVKGPPETLLSDEDAVKLDAMEKRKYGTKIDAKELESGPAMLRKFSDKMLHESKIHPGGREAEIACLVAFKKVKPRLLLDDAEAVGKKTLEWRKRVNILHLGLHSEWEKEISSGGGNDKTTRFMKSFMQRNQLVYSYIEGGSEHASESQAVHKECKGVSLGDLDWDKQVGAQIRGLVERIAQLEEGAGEFYESEDWGRKIQEPGGATERVLNDEFGEKWVQSTEDSLKKFGPALEEAIYAVKDQGEKEGEAQGADYAEKKGKAEKGIPCLKALSNLSYTGLLGKPGQKWFEWKLNPKTSNFSVGHAEFKLAAAREIKGAGGGGTNSTQSAVAGNVQRGANNGTNTTDSEGNAGGAGGASKSKAGDDIEPKKKEAGPSSICCSFLETTTTHAVDSDSCRCDSRPTPEPQALNHDPRLQNQMGLGFLGCSTILLLVTLGAIIILVVRGRRSDSRSRGSGKQGVVGKKFTKKSDSEEVSVADSDSDSEVARD